VEGEVLLGADGLWSRVREQLLHDGPPLPTGHLAYRATVPQAQLPQRLRTGQVNVWLAPRLHAVAYPVSAGEALNVVVIVDGPMPPGDPQSWDHAASVDGLRQHLRHHAGALRDLVDAVPQWRLWPLHDREPMQGPAEHGRGMVALLGDAAHPMRPYMAQGAGMAIEDAHALGQAFAMAEAGVPIVNLLRHYALGRWARNARVQARSRRNGQIFHAAGPMRWGRNLSMRLLGERLMDVPWLYQGVATPP
jgi:salicylate hydroxylase